MDNNLILKSIGIGGALFVGLVVFWFVSMYLKKRLASDQAAQGYTPSTRTSWEEKRRHPRIAVSWQAFIEIPGQTDSVQLKDISLGGAIEIPGQTDSVQLKDISLGGAFVVCAEPLALNEKLKISIRIPNQEPLRLNAEVVWSNRNMSADRVVNRGMGIRFIENTDKDRQRLNEALAVSLEDSQAPVHNCAHWADGNCHIVYNIIDIN